MDALKSLHPQSPAITNKQGSESNKCLNNKQQVIVFSVFAAQWASMVLSVALNLSFTTEQIKAMELDPRLQTPPIYHALAMEKQLL